MPSGVYKRTKKHKLHLGRAMKGNQNNKGTKWPKETSLRVGKKRSGKNAPNWQGGITPENRKLRNSIQFRLWRESVFARDNWTCQKYGVRGVKLHPHHVKNFAQYPELRFAIDNGITLSDIAHFEFHLLYGKKNNTREQLEEFLSS